jgi:hypothetical protein
MLFLIRDKSLTQPGQAILHYYDKQQYDAAQNELPPRADLSFEIEQIKNHAEQQNADER